MPLGLDLMLQLLASAEVGATLTDVRPSVVLPGFSSILPRPTSPPPRQA